jgi:PP-loop superfamily ATP-utilizing enzyme
MKHILQLFSPQACGFGLLIEKEIGLQKEARNNCYFCKSQSPRVLRQEIHKNRKYESSGSGLSLN